MEMEYNFVVNVDKYTDGNFFINIEGLGKNENDRHSGLTYYNQDINEFFKDYGIKLNYTSLALLHGAFIDSDGEIFFKSEKKARKVALLLRIEIQRIKER